MEKTIESLLNEIKTATDPTEIDDLCKRIKKLDTCKDITLIIHLGLYPSYAKLVYWEIRQREKQLKNAA
jgi:hypothetical protein